MIHAANPTPIIFRLKFDDRRTDMCENIDH